MIYHQHIFYISYWIYVILHLGLLTAYYYFTFSCWEVETTEDMLLDYSFAAIMNQSTNQLIKKIKKIE